MGIHALRVWLRCSAPSTESGAFEGLSGREREVFGLLARGLSGADVARALFVGEATVKSHVSKAFQKLGLRDRVHTVVFASEHGGVTRS